MLCRRWGAELSRAELSSTASQGLVQDVREGPGYRSIAERLNIRGVPSARQGKWPMTSVRDLTGNPVYVGDMVWNRRTMAKFHRIESGRAVPMPKAKHRAIEHNDEDDWVVTRDAHPALIDRRLFEQAQALRRQRSRGNADAYRRGRRARSDYLLTGLIVCAHCGNKWSGHTAHKAGRKKDGTTVKTQYYICSGYQTKGKSVCSRHVIPKDEIEGQVFDAIGEHIRQYVGTPEGRGKLKAALARELPPDGGDHAAELERLRLQREAVLRKINGILDNITETNREFADQRIAALKKELRRIEPQILELEAARDTAPDLDALTDDMLAYMECFDEVVAEGTVEQKRRFVRSFLRCVRVAGDRYRVEPEVALSAAPSSTCS